MNMPRFNAEASLYKTRRYYCTSAHLYEGNDLPGSADSFLRLQRAGLGTVSCATRCAATCSRRCASDPQCYDYCFEECIDIHCCEEGCEPCKLFGGQCQQFCIDDDCNQGMVPCACPPGQTCTVDGCCSVSQTCGQYCCTGNEVCSNQQCCNPCGSDCCERGMICKDGQCCTPYSQGCCPRGQYCGKDVCCPPGTGCFKNPRGNVGCIRR